MLISDFLCAKKWLIIEPTSPQSLKTIYQVLRFAWKHTAPLNRSALTYWEEDVPSRMDLGKSRYGGPFTTAQVEDVKTVLRLIPICLMLLLLGGTLAIFHGVYGVIKIPGWTLCMSRLLKSITYDSSFCFIVWTILYEFAIYPLIRNRLPSILKRIGIISSLITAFSFVLLLLEVAHNYAGNVVAINSVVIILYVVFTGLLPLLLVSTMLEFVCAQAPYNMRGLFGGFIVFIFEFTLSLKIFLPDDATSLIAYGVKAGVTLVGFVLYCLLARWYKMRVRDEEYDVHRVVEEVYDRYLSAR